MIEIDWNNDERSTDVNKYLVDPHSDNESRRKAFLGGWNPILEQRKQRQLRWGSLGGLGYVVRQHLGRHSRGPEEGHLPNLARPIRRERPSEALES